MSKADLSFSAFEKLGDITAMDSAEVLEKVVTEKKTFMIDEFYHQLEHYTHELEKQQEELSKADSETVKKLFEKEIEEINSHIDQYNESIATYKGDCKGTTLEPMIKKIAEYKANPDELLASKYQASYSINENEAETKIFYLLGKNVLKSEEL